jgi:hypothetical protein
MAQHKCRYCKGNCPKTFEFCCQECLTAFFEREKLQAYHRHIQNSVRGKLNLQHESIYDDSLGVKRHSPDCVLCKTLKNVK